MDIESFISVFKLCNFSVDCFWLVDSEIFVKIKVKIAPNRCYVLGGFSALNLT